MAQSKRENLLKTYGSTSEHSCETGASKDEMDGESEKDNLHEAYSVKTAMNVVNQNYTVPREFEGAYFSIADRYRARGEAPDHTEEARRECTYRFIECIILVRMEDDTPLSALELQRIALEFKRAYAREHPTDFSEDFELIVATEMELWQLCVTCDRKKGTSEKWAEITPLVKRASTEIGRILDESEEELFSV